MISQLSERQAEILDFIDSDSNYLICDGAVRAGKTTVMVIGFVVWAMEYFNNCNFAICGKTVQSAERNIMLPLLGLEELPYSRSYRISDRMLTIRCGSKQNHFYLFGGKDESSYQLIQGITLAGALLDEVALMPHSFVDQVIARTLTYANKKIWFNCNPEGNRHWFYLEWVLRTDRGELSGSEHLHFLMSDNPVIGPEELAKAEASFTGVFYDRYIRGLWVAAEGRIYDCFDEKKHVTSTLPELAGEYYVSCDYGTQNATVYLLWRKERDTYRWVCVREYYYSGRDKKRQKTDKEFAADLRAWLDGITPKKVIVDPSAASFIAELQQCGYPVLQADNDVLGGIHVVAAELQANELLFSSDCKNTIAEFQSYVWDEKAADRGEDKPVKISDHCMDAIRYFRYTMRSRTVRVNRLIGGI